MKTKELMVFGILLLCACDDKSSQADGPGAKGKNRSGGFYDDNGPGAEKAGVRKPKEKSIPVAEPVPGHPGKVKSPYTGDLVDVTLHPPGDIVQDPGFPGNEEKLFIVPNGVELSKAPIPEAKYVGGKPGFVYSPHNNEPVDIRGLPPGAMIEDPGFPGPDKRFLKLPLAGQTLEPTPDTEEGAPKEEEAPKEPRERVIPEGPKDEAVQEEAPQEETPEEEE